MPYRTVNETLVSRLHDSSSIVSCDQRRTKGLSPQPQLYFQARLKPSHRLPDCGVSHPNGAERLSISALPFLDFPIASQSQGLCLPAPQLLTACATTDPPPIAPKHVVVSELRF
jgi:hypothetical protein